MKNSNGTHSMQNFYNKKLCSISEGWAIMTWRPTRKRQVLGGLACMVDFHYCGWKVNLNRIHLLFGSCQTNQTVFVMGADFGRFFKTSIYDWTFLLMLAYNPVITQKMWDCGGVSFLGGQMVDIWIVMTFLTICTSFGSIHASVAIFLLPSLAWEDWRWWPFLSVNIQCREISLYSLERLFFLRLWIKKGFACGGVSFAGDHSVRFIRSFSPLRLRIICFLPSASVSVSQLSITLRGFGGWGCKGVSDVIVFLFRSFPDNFGWKYSMRIVCNPSVQNKQFSCWLSKYRAAMKRSRRQGRNTDNWLVLAVKLLNGKKYLYQV